MVKNIQIAIATRMYKNAMARYNKSKKFADLEAVGYWRNRIFFLECPHAIPSAW